MLIGGIQKSSLIDYPKKIAAVIFTKGCNFSCPYCHNPELVSDLSNIVYSEEYVLSFLDKRIGKLDGVVISGGEPTLQQGLDSFIRKIKQKGFCIKLDTNGTNPNLVEKLIGENLLDYIAMDIKAPYDEYKKVTRRDINIEDIKKSVEIISNSNIDFEFRTTVVKGLLNYESFEKINDIFKTLPVVKCYYLQKFQKSKHVDKNFENAKSIDDIELEKIVNLLKNTVQKVEVR